MQSVRFFFFTRFESAFARRLRSMQVSAPKFHESYFLIVISPAPMLTMMVNVGPLPTCE